MSYYNTTNEVNPEMSQFRCKSKRQDTIVLNIAKKLNKRFSASEIFKEYPTPNTPITSIRRAINTLKNDNKIKQLDIKTVGLYGRNEFLYEIL